MSGLKLVKRHSSCNWYIRGTLLGVTVDESSGTDRRDLAEKIRIKRENEIAQRAIYGTQATATFLEAAVKYMEAGGERRYVGRLLDPIGPMPLKDIDQAVIDRVAKLLLPGRKQSTVNRQIHTVISAVLKFAHKRGMCELRQIERPKQPKGRVRWLTPEEADRLIESCSPHLRPLIAFMLYSGARLSEALFLDWRQVDLPRAHVHFLATKNGDDRGVPLHPRVVREIAALPHREGMVFRRPDGQPYARCPGRGSPIKTAFNAACRRAGIHDFHPHDCRHTWATWHYAANRDLVSLMQLGGWRSEKMVLRYCHVNVSHLAGSIAALPWGNSGERERAKAG